MAVPFIGAVPLAWMPRATSAIPLWKHCTQDRQLLVVAAMQGDMELWAWDRRLKASMNQ